MSFRSEFPFSSGRLGAVALAAVLIGAAPLAGCQGLSDMTGSIASIRQPLPTDEAGLRAYADDWGKRYDRNPGEKVASINYARALRALTRYSEAAAVMQAAAVKAPQDFEVLGAYGKALADDGQFEQAKEVLARSYTPERPDWTIMSVQGSVADRLGDHEGAQKFYTRRAEDRAGRAVGALQPRPFLRADQAAAGGRGGVARGERQPARRRAGAAEPRAGAGARRQVRRGRAGQPTGHDGAAGERQCRRRSGR